ncbi:MAG: hypothetical protein ABR505_12130 [Actinomycetota bacterium]
MSTITKRMLAAVLGMALIGAEGALPANAQPPARVPKRVQIVDPAGDANYLNGQGDPGQGDMSTPADLSVSDILSVWFTNDADTISVHIQTEVPPPSANAAYLFRVEVNPSGNEEEGCLWFEAAVGGPTYVGETFGRLRDQCAEDAVVEGELTIVEAADGTGITTVIIPRDAHLAFAAGAVISAPWAQVRNHFGALGQDRFPAVADDTTIGSDYSIVDGRRKGKQKRERSGAAGDRARVSRRSRPG